MVAYVRATNYNKLILMQATAERVMGGGFRQNSVSELKLKNRCTGSTHEMKKILVCGGERRWSHAPKVPPLDPPLVCRGTF